MDIAFSTDEGVIFLSDLESNGVLENCGWFSKLFKKVAVASKITDMAYTKIEDKVDAAVQELRKRRPNDTIIYRMGSNIYYNLTPRVTDVDGLSFYTGGFYGKCVITTKQLVDMTGTLTAVGNGHVLIRPVAGDMAAWIATKNTADVSPLPYSVSLKQIVIRIA